MDKQGIGGWLAFFIATLGVISPALTVAQTAFSMRRGDWSSLAVTTSFSLGAAIWALVVIGSTIGCGLAVLLLTVRRSVVIPIVIGGMWALATADIVLRGLAIDAAYGAPAFTLLRSLTLNQFRPLVFCTIWSAYLLRSKRVALTYRREPVGDPLAEVFR